MSKNKLYSMLLIACFFGFIYLFYSIHYSEKDTFRVCIIKNATGFPCPSCGTTRAVTLLLEGKFTESVALNPFGILVAIIMTLFPIWILIDLLLKKDTFFNSYKKAEVIIRTKWLAFFLLLLVILNWIWNIKKQL
ncbi:DUF2752 domain-containing protein [Flavobacterium sp. RSB2_4_14]|uniref:DUF2752 domain-containing protein n=1 Tax=Flavobacterium sp. RSB2_4_14 TaxID=3447665 RepID=UPI003F39467E